MGPQRVRHNKGWSVMQSQQCPQLTPGGTLKMTQPFRVVLLWDKCTCSVTSVVPDSATPWTVAHQAPLSMGFSRQDYWSGLPCSSPRDLPHPHLLCILHCRWILHPLSHLGSPSLDIGALNPGQSSSRTHTPTAQQGVGHMVDPPNRMNL